MANGVYLEVGFPASSIANKMATIKRQTLQVNSWWLDRNNFIYLVSTGFGISWTPPSHSKDVGSIMIVNPFL